MMQTVMNWLHMGGYSLYVWSAYGLAVLVLVLNMFSIKRQRIRIRKKIADWIGSTH